MKHLIEFPEDYNSFKNIESGLSVAVIKNISSIVNLCSISSGFLSDHACACNPSLISASSGNPYGTGNGSLQNCKLTCELAAQSIN